MKRKKPFCLCCFHRTGKKTPIVGPIFTCSYTAYGKAYSHVVCVECARGSEQSGITVHPKPPKKKVSHA